MVRRVVIAALEIIPTGFVVVDVAAIADGVAVDEGGGAGAVSRSGIGGDVAPGVVGIAAVPLLLIQSRCPVFQNAEDALHVALQIRRVEVWSEIGSAVLRVAHRKGLAGFIIDKVHDDGSVAVGEGFPHQLSVEGVVGVGHTAHGLLGADAVGVVGIGRRLAAYRHRGQLPPVGPCQARVGLAAVIPVGRIAAIVRDGRIAHLGQQILPVVLAIGIALRGGRRADGLCLREDIPGGVVGTIV